MDPNVVLTLFLRALEIGEREAALDHLAALQEWIEKGGFLPFVEFDSTDMDVSKVYLHSEGA